MALSPKSERHDGAGWRQRAVGCRELAEMFGAAGKEKLLAIAVGYEDKAAVAEREHEATFAAPRVKPQRKRATRSEARS